MCIIQTSIARQPNQYMYSDLNTYIFREFLDRA
jgi:hypothetical protein